MAYSIASICSSDDTVSPQMHSKLRIAIHLHVECPLHPDAASVPNAGSILVDKLCSSTFSGSCGSWLDLGGPHSREQWGRMVEPTYLPTYLQYGIGSPVPPWSVH
ncbi:hypothetical protein WG66_010752 [Moniliophthora roreri]|nr:hypothetical protein WG66_010752 [Moniliophthora roreri]